MEENNLFRDVKAIFFDFDNTLVSFDEVEDNALHMVAKDIYNFVKDNYSSEISQDKITELVISRAKKMNEDGIYDRKSWWKSVLDQLNVSAESEELYQWTQLYWSIASQNTPYEDALDLLEYLKKKGFRLGIITNSDGEGGDKRLRLSRFPLLHYFNIIVIGGENNIKPKPDLQPFIISCEKFGLFSSQCLMIGDDPIKDCLAAKKAGLKSILVDRKNKVKFAELYADYVVNNLREVEELF
ncbi:HAD family hydrolase [Sulfolobus acidocaldarius]|uniref:Haloacid dehalogenase-like hydrolase n=4 Tax=Sulfolobus acidocaldarius TaxID=2285 RepID=Q4JB35_SULAC|nr:HAD family hydrolase [Sulfolobus acidocaldarius]AAY79994.1 haloacid dehalogenase-like hydrolase [Sulfolobus acidocaldarius DSM 639]AGE70563.1 haloacid dehalogenase-like hydrolase [Sulfolobus acidocaldarius N8]AGE72836.1 haloacid dehalogenase-like hydrolase [Sulfolobus acidocaldarius Ron12/I]ALU29078.1 2-haloalkanoic acid dehalogenase [Sulfolobus acidocaldarius]ALU31804.1 2-haloalkanoic acid dehalogenase [Sulfolobus acidocaldarius]